MRRWLLLGLLLLAPLALAGDDERNLVPNGSFDEGADGATEIPGWTEVDGLTSFLESAPGRGRVLRLDTDVKLSEADERWKEMEKPAGERPPAKPKGPTVDPKYDTVGGTTGAKIYSDYIRVEPGMRYRLRADVKSDAPVVMIFVKGYARLEGGFRKFYQCYKNVKPATGQWAMWERTFNPTLKSPKVTHIRVMPYAYWPPGQAWIDRIEVTRVGQEDPERVEAGANLLAADAFDGKRIEAGQSLTSPRVEVAEGRAYRLVVRARPEGAVLRATVDGLVKFGGKEVALYTETGTLAPAAEGAIDLDLPFHPTAETPQVSHVTVRLAVEGGAGAVVVESARLTPEEGRPADGEKDE